MRGLCDKSATNVRGICGKSPEMGIIIILLIDG